MLLHVIANPRNLSQSRSRRIASVFLEGYRERHPEAAIQEVDLFKEELPMVDALDINTRIHQFGGDLTGEEKTRFERFMRYIRPLQEANHLLITTPMWNFGPPWRLKQWIDTVVQARVTFQYTAEGPQGLLKGKKAAIVGSRGGAYAEGDPRETSDYLVPYLKRVLGWVGIDDVSVCIAEGVDMQRERLEEVLAETERRARDLGASF